MGRIFQTRKMRACPWLWVLSLVCCGHVTGAPVDAVDPRLVPTVELSVDALPADMQMNVSLVTADPMPGSKMEKLMNGLSLTPEQMEGGITRQKLSVCIPCIPRDMSKLPGMLRSITAGSLQPEEIIIAISETSIDEASNLQSMLSGFAPGIKILYTPEKQTAGQNRNRAFVASTGEFISFFDADDEMHHQRLQIVREALEQTNVKCVIHGYARSRETGNFDWHTAHQIKGSQIFRNIVESEHTENVQVKAEGVRITSRYNGLGPHHGHPTCRAGVLRAIRFAPDERGQDSMFLRRVLQYYGETDRSMLYIDLPLSIYFPSDHEDNKDIRK